MRGPESPNFNKFESGEAKSEDSQKEGGRHERLMGVGSPDSETEAEANQESETDEEIADGSEGLPEREALQEEIDTEVERVQEEVKELQENLDAISGEEEVDAESQEKLQSLGGKLSYGLAGLSTLAGAAGVGLMWHGFMKAGVDVSPLQEAANEAHTFSGVSTEEKIGVVTFFGSAVIFQVNYAIAKLKKWTP